MIDRDLHGRVADNSVSVNRVALDSRGKEDPIHIPEDSVVLDRIAGVGGRDETDSEITPLRRESISA